MSPAEFQELLRETGLVADHDACGWWIRLCCVSDLRLRYWIGLGALSHESLRRAAVHLQTEQSAIARTLGLPSAEQARRQVESLKALGLDANAADLVERAERLALVFPAVRAGDVKTAQVGLEMARG